MALRLPLATVIFFCPLVLLHASDICLPQLLGSRSLLRGTPEIFQRAAQRIQAQPTPPSWTGLRIDDELIDRLGRLQDPHQLIQEIEAYADVEIVTTTAEDRQAMNLSITTPLSGPTTLHHHETPLSADQAQTILKPLRQKMSRSPQIVTFIESSAQAFKRVAARGQFIPARTDPYKTGAKNSRPTILLKDFADRETILHEFVHVLLDRERERLGLPKPFPDLENQLTEVTARLERTSVDSSQIEAVTVDYWTKRTEYLLATSGEELDVHGLIVDRRAQFSLADSSSAIQSALANYQNEMNRMASGLAEAQRAVAGLGGTQKLDAMIEQATQKLAQSHAWLNDQQQNLAPTTKLSRR